MWSIKFVLLFKQQVVWHGDSTERTKDWVFQQKSEPPHLEVSPVGRASSLRHGPWDTVDKILGKLQLISSKVHSMASKTSGR